MELTISLVFAFSCKFKDFIAAAWWKFLQQLRKSNQLRLRKIKSVHALDRLMRNIQNRHEFIHNRQT